MKDKILITGITGFVGSNLKKYLTPYFQVVGVSRSNISESILYNHLEKIMFDASKAFIHLAGKAHDLKKTGNESDYFEVNTELTKQLFDTFLQSNCPKFIYMSSVKAAADEVEGILTEEIYPKPKTAYGKSKLMAEDYILDNLPADKKVFILRPCMIHGPGNKGNLNLLYQIVNKGIPSPLGAFDNKRSFCSIDNVCFVIQNIIERNDVPSGIYNLADDEPLSTNELINLIAESQNRKPRIWELSKGVIRCIATMGDKLHLPFNSERLQKLTESYVVSNEKIKKELNKPLPVNSKEGLLKTFQSFNHE